MERQPWRLGARGERLFDAALVAVLVLPVLSFPFAGMPWHVTLLCLLEILPLWLRRRHPWATFVAVAVAHAVQVLLVDTPIWGQVAFPVAVYSVARFGRPWQGYAAVGVGLAAAVAAAVDWLLGFGGLDVYGLTAYTVTISTIVVAAWAIGALARTRRAFVESLIERGRRLELENRQRAEIVAAEERARIAREMHDVVAHGLSVIVVQADGARYAATQRPEVAAGSLETIAATARQSLTEMRRMLGLLREGGGDTSPTGVNPMPGLADLPALVAAARESGAQLEADLPARLPEVPEAAGLTAYRVAQEALTNVRKHAGPAASARLAVRASARELRVEVDDDGRGPATRGDGVGLGLLGMRERVAAHGGTLEAGPVPGGGFRVAARIPT